MGGRVAWVLVAFLSMVAGGCAGQGTPLKVMSFNIRNSGAKDGEDAWQKRKDFYVETIRTYAPDLLGMQEVLPDQAEYMKEKMPDYGYVGVGRDDGKNKGEASPCMWRKDRFELLDSGQFWLSGHPDQPGSKGWDAALTRICSWVKLKDKVAGVELVYLNSHWDHVGVEARTESGKLMRRMATQIVDTSPVIVTGDFNSTEDSPAYKAMVADLPGAVTLVDSYREVHPERKPDEASFHGFKGTVEGSRIDFILHSPHFVAKAAQIVHVQRNGHYPSDHYPVTADLVLKK